MGFFEKKVDRRSRQEMTDFLHSHARYSTMNSWNGMTSYANNIKITRLGLTHQQIDRAFDLLDTDDLNDMVVMPAIRDFTDDNRGYNTIGINGRSGGYAVLLDSYYERIQHRSFCLSCGQFNFKHVPPELSEDQNVATIARVIRNGNNFNISNLIPLMEPEIAAIDLEDAEKQQIITRVLTAYREGVDATGNCGVCSEPRRDFARVPQHLKVSGKGIDQLEDYYPEDWDMNDLRNRVNLVCEFDRACDQMRDDFIGILGTCEVVEETVHIPQTRRRIECRA